MQTRIIYTKIWEDSFFSDLKNDYKILFLFYLTNNRVNLINCYEISDKMTCFYCGVSKEVLSEFKKFMSEHKKLSFNGDYICILNANRYQNYEGSKNDQSKQKIFNLLPQNIKDWFISLFDRVSIPYAYSIDRVCIPLEIRNQKSEIRNQKKKGGVGENKKQTLLKVKNEFSTLESLKTLDDIRLDILAQEFDVPVAFVRSKLDDLENYCGRTGKTYKDYWLALRNFVKKDAMGRLDDERKARLNAKPSGFLRIS